MDSLAVDPLVGFGAALRSTAVRTARDLATLERRLHRARTVVLVCGGGIAGLTAASTLAREGTAEIVLVVGPPPVRKRLVDGCTLRRSAIGTLAAATGTASEKLVERLGGKRAVFDGAVIVRGVERSPAWSISSSAAVSFPDMLGLSSRHGEILQALREVVPHSSRLHLVAGVVQGETDGALSIALEDGAQRLKVPQGRSFILNATGKANLFDPSAPVATPRRWAVAVQAPMRIRSHGPRWGASTAVAFMFESPSLTHMALFTPFADPDTPDAGWYAINTTVMTNEALEAHGRERTLAEVRSIMLEMGKELDLEPVDLAEAAGEAVFSADRAFHSPVGTPLPVVHASSRFSPGVAAINTDGMLAGAVGAYTFARNFARRTVDGAARRDVHEALLASERALDGIRRRNESAEWSFFHAPPFARAWMIRGLRAAPMRAFFAEFAALGYDAN